MKRRVLMLAAAFAVATPMVAHAVSILPGVSLQIGGGDDRLSTPLQIVTLLTLLSLAPAILVTFTAFVRIVIVLSFLRQAVGTQQMPPNQVVCSSMTLHPDKKHGSLLGHKTFINFSAKQNPFVSFFQL